jgi:hypothetical protein
MSPCRPYRPCLVVRRLPWLAPHTPARRPAGRMGNRPRSDRHRRALFPARSDELCGCCDGCAVEAGAREDDRAVARQLYAVVLAVRAARVVCAPERGHTNCMDRGRLAGGRIALSASRPHQDRSEEIGQIIHISALVPKGSMLVLVGKELARPTARRRSPCGPLTFRRRRRGGTYNIARSFVASKFLILHIYFTPGRHTLPDNFDGSIRNDPRAWNVSKLGREA